jgi:hypothetical protein
MQDTALPVSALLLKQCYRLDVVLSTKWQLSVGVLSLKGEQAASPSKATKTLSPNALNIERRIQTTI